MRYIPPITKNLLIINILMFAADFVLLRQGINLQDMLGLHFFLADNFRPHQFFTYMFMHGSLMHLFFNMFALWMFGGIIERTQGARRFLFFYLVCGLGAGICQEIAQYVHYMQMDIQQIAGSYVYSAIESFEQGQYYRFTTPIIPVEPTSCVITENSSIPVIASTYLNLWSCVGASGSIYGILLAFGMYYPNERMFIIPIPFPIKAKYLVLGYVVIELMDVLNSVHDGVAHIAHLGGMVFGAAIILYWRYLDNRNNHGGATYITFDSYHRGY